MNIVLKIFRFIGFTLLCIFSGGMLGAGGLFGIISLSCIYKYLMARCPELMSLIVVFIISLISVTFSIWLFNICLSKKWWK
jgi:hypothetical protein